MFSLRKRKTIQQNQYYEKCEDHNTMVKKLSRIEGENVAIIALVIVILLLVVERLL